MTLPRSDQLAWPITLALECYDARRRGDYDLANQLWLEVYLAAQAEGLRPNNARDVMYGAAAISAILQKHGETDNVR